MPKTIEQTATRLAHAWGADCAHVWTVWHSGGKPCTTQVEVLYPATDYPDSDTRRKVSQAIRKAMRERHGTRVSVTSGRI